MRPAALPMPLQSALVAEAQHRISRAASTEGSGAQKLANYFVGQVVGQLDRIRPARQVVLDMMTEYAEVAQRFADQVAEEVAARRRVGLAPDAGAGREHHRERLDSRR